MIGLLPYRRRVAAAPLVLFANSIAATYPAGLQDGDVGFLLEAVTYGTAYSSAASVPGLLLVPGFTELVYNQTGYSYLGPGQNAVRQYGGRRARVSYRSLTAAMSGTAIGGNPAVRRLVVFRQPADKPMSLVTMRGISNATALTEAVNFSAQPEPILPLYAFVKTSVAAYPALTFDGVAPTYFDIIHGEAACRLGALTGPQPSRSITMSMSTTGAVEHAVFNLK